MMPSRQLTLLFSSPRWMALNSASLLGIGPLISVHQRCIILGAGGADGMGLLVVKFHGGSDDKP